LVRGKGGDPSQSFLSLMNGGKKIGVYRKRRESGRTERISAVTLKDGGSRKSKAHREEPDQKVKGSGSSWKGREGKMVKDSKTRRGGSGWGGGKRTTPEEIKHRRIATRGRGGGVVKTISENRLDLYLEEAGRELLVSIIRKKRGDLTRDVFSRKEKVFRVSSSVRNEEIHQWVGGNVTE